MASIFKRKNKNGTTVWQAIVRIKGHPSACNHCERKQEAGDWAIEIERQIKTGRFKFDQHNKIYTFKELVERYIQDGSLEHHRSSADTLRHLKYWKSRFEDYDLVHITPEFIGKERLLHIKAVYVAPNAGTWFKELTESIIKKSSYSFKLIHSVLSKEPVF